MKKYLPGKTVIDILSLVFQKDYFFQDAFGEVLSKEPRASEHRAYIFRLSKGVTERYVMLTAVLKKLSGTPPEKLRPAIRYILLSGLYELSCMDTPEHAAVNEAVKLTESLGFGSLKGFVNGNLRTFIRERESLMNSLRISERLGLPDGLFLLLKRTYGLPLTEKMAEAFFAEGKTTLRRLTSKISGEEFLLSVREDGLEAENTGVTGHSYYLTGGSPERLSAFRSGLCYAQDLSSMLDGEIGAKVLLSREDPGPESPEGGERVFSVLDTCGAPGGKSIDLLDALHGKTGKFVTCDVSERKAELIRENFTRLGFTEADVRVQDASEPLREFYGAFDLVVADVPCSGIGIIGRKPDIRFRVTREALGELEALQGKILSNVSLYVKPGGWLIYSTCTLNPGENREQVRKFLGEHPGFTEEDVRPYLPEAYRESPDIPSLPAGNDLTVLPGIHPSDGFYVSLLRKKVNCD